MPFGLKNVSATYQRAMMVIFHDMIYIDMEVYVDDILVKLRTRAEHPGKNTLTILGTQS